MNKNPGQQRDIRTGGQDNEGTEEQKNSDTVRGEQWNRRAAEEQEKQQEENKGTGEQKSLTVQHVYGHGGWAAVGGNTRIVPGVPPGGMGDQEPAGSRVLICHQLDAPTSSFADLFHLHAVPCIDTKVNVGLDTISRSFGR